jgi:predicted nucleic acid-binding protein
MGACFLIDTHVFAELMRKAPATEVVAWFAARQSSLVYTTSISQAEILTGIALLPEGKRRDGLAQAAQALFEQDLAGRCLDFDSAAAKQYALVVSQRLRNGRSISTEDAQIAAIALATGYPVVTRNVKDFLNIDGLSVVNPWQSH